MDERHDSRPYEVDSNSLDDLTDEENNQSEGTINWRKFAADTSFAIMFGIVVGAGNEAYAGMSVDQIVKSRALSIPTNTIIGRPYGIYREYVLNKLGVDEGSGFIKRTLSDISAFATFQMPVYCGILYAAGADNEQMLTAAGTITVLSGFFGRPYGWMLDKWRTLWGVHNETKDINNNR